MNIVNARLLTPQIAYFFITNASSSKMLALSFLATLFEFSVLLTFHPLNVYPNMLKILTVYLKIFYTGTWRRPLKEKKALIHGSMPFLVHFFPDNSNQKQERNIAKEEGKPAIVDDFGDELAKLHVNKLAVHNMKKCKQAH
jgi:hypothetical protein